MRIGFIGSGKVGFSLGKFLVERGIKVTGFYNRHQEEAKKAAEYTNTTCYREIEELVKNSDMIFITVSDGAINSIYEQLKNYKIDGKYICHASGAMTAGEAFPDVDKYNAYGYSVHPLLPISSKYNSYRDLTDAFFCIEGSDEHIEEVADLFRIAASNVKIIGKNNKVKYHAACAISSNLVCALIDESVKLLGECGFSREEALMALKPLGICNIQNAFERGPIEALTGPVERCDSDTVKKHLETFDDVDERMMYVYATKRLVRIAKEKHPERDYSDLMNLISEEIR